MLNRVKPNTNLAREIAEAAEKLSAVAKTTLGQRVAYAETLGKGLAVVEAGKSAASAEVQALAAEVALLLQDG